MVLGDNYISWGSKSIPLNSRYHFLFIIVVVVVVIIILIIIVASCSCPGTRVEIRIQLSGVGSLPHVWIPETKLELQGWLDKHFSPRAIFSDPQLHLLLEMQPVDISVKGSKNKTVIFL